MSTVCERHARFFRSTGWTTVEYAKRLKCSRTMVSLILHGHRSPGLRIAASIERLSANWSEGAILATDWVGEPGGGEQEAKAA
ncbi:MAG: helix-turn-helix transcriptional regulator [Myxococcales bacterium]|nr:helix-turn-helix transcriptional regulator [Myxococcales bacterium]